jgi:hypothetical protein
MGRVGAAAAVVDLSSPYLPVNDDEIWVRRPTGTVFGAYELWTTNLYYGHLRTQFADVDGDGGADAIVVNTHGTTVR